MTRKATEWRIDADGAIHQSAALPAHPPLDRFALGPAERSVIDATEARLRDRHPRLYKITRKLAGHPAQAMQIALPRTANEKFAWRKMFDHDPLFVTVSDKIAVKDWLDTNDLLRAPAMLWSGDDVAEIPPALMARRCLLKAAHGWKSQLFIRPGQTTLDEVQAAGREMLARRHGAYAYQSTYDLIPSRLLIEEELVPAPGRDLEEYKLYFFGGRLDRVVGIFDRYGTIAGLRLRMDENGVVRRFEGEGADVSKVHVARPLPPNWARIVDAGFRIARHFDHVRVDMLTDGDTLRLGEVTLYNLSGCYTLTGNDPASDATLHWDLRETWFLRTPQGDPDLEAYRLTLAAILDRAGAQAAPRLASPPASPTPAAGPSRTREQTMSNYATGDYWEKRSDMLYYRYIDYIMRTVARSATSVIDVGSGNCPYLEWFYWIDKRVSVDIRVPYSSDTVEGIQGDIHTLTFERKFDVCTCFQVMEHVPEAAAFGRRLLELADRVILSLPYEWPENSTTGHVHDPVTRAKMVDWMGREPNFEIVVEEPSQHAKARRIIAIFDADPAWRFKESNQRRPSHTTRASAGLAPDAGAQAVRAASEAARAAAEAARAAASAAEAAAAALPAPKPEPAPQPEPAAATPAARLPAPKPPEKIKVTGVRSAIKWLRS